MDHFQFVTELPGEPVSAEQIERLVNRYVWASSYCRSMDVVEAACGAGPGLGLLAAVARSLAAGDISAPILARAVAHYGGRVSLREFDALSMPFDDESKDVLLLFEAIYYLSDPTQFIRECRRVLRPNGHVLIVTANKDLWDFHKSPYTYRYFGVSELNQLFCEHGFQCEFFGFQNVQRTSIRQRLVRPLKRLAVLGGLMPKTMAGKRWLKRLVFGPPVLMPNEVTADLAPFVPPARIDPDRPDTSHKIIYCAARLRAAS